MQQFKALGAQRRCDDAYTGDIAARSIEASDETVLDGVVAATDEDNRNFGGRGFGCLCRGTATGSNYHCHLVANQIGSHRRQSIVLPFRPPVFDC